MLKGSALLEVEPEMESRWIVEAAMQCGLYSVAGMGGVMPILWTDIWAWQQATGQPSYWLAEAVHKCSRQYVHHYHDGAKQGSVSPMQSHVDDTKRRLAVAEQFKAFAQSRQQKKG